MSLFEDQQFSRTTFVTIDFETLTPRGRRPEAIEVAVLARQWTSDQGTSAGWVERWRFESLIKPPSDVRVTPLDSAQTGITAAMLSSAPPAAAVLSSVDELLAEPPYLLIAHNARYEAGLIYDHAKHCSRLARLSLLDTVRMSRIAHPELSRHRLDSVLGHLRIPVPLHRHRAMPDTEVTAQIFEHMAEAGNKKQLWSTLDDLFADIGIDPKITRIEQEAAQPQQGTLF